MGKSLVYEAFELETFDQATSFYTLLIIGRGQRDRQEFGTDLADAISYAKNFIGPNGKRPVVYALAPSGRHVCLDRAQGPFWLERFNQRSTVVTANESTTIEKVEGYNMIYAIAVTGKGSPWIKAFASKEAALKTGNGFAVIKDAADLLTSTIKTGAMVMMYNSLVPKDKAVKKFETREKACQRLLSVVLAPEAGAPIEGPKTSAEPGAKKASRGVKSGATKAKATGPKEARGKKGAYSGMLLFPIGEAVKENPRRKGSGGYQSMEIIRSNAGISYEDFITKGGRSKDLAWDIKGGSAEARKA